MPTNRPESFDGGASHRRVSRRMLFRSALPTLAVIAGAPATGLAPEPAAKAPLNPRNRAAAVDADSVIGPVDSVDAGRSTVTLGTVAGGQVVVQCAADTVVWSDTFVELDALRRYQMVTVTGAFRDGVFWAATIEALYRGVDLTVHSVDDDLVVTDAGPVLLTRHTRDDETDARPAVASLRSGRPMRALVRDDPLSGTMIALRVLG